MEFVGIGSEGDSEIRSEGGEGDGVGEVDHYHEHRAPSEARCEV